MYGVINMILFPDKHDPQLLSLELFPSFDEAKKRTRVIIEEFIDEYGEDYINNATEEKPIAIMYNGEVTAYAYIQKVTE